MSSNIEKVKSIFKSPGIAAVLRWSKLRYFDGAVCLLNFGAGQRAAHVFNGPQNSHEEKNKEDSPFRN